MASRFIKLHVLGGGAQVCRIGFVAELCVAEAQEMLRSFFQLKVS